MCPWKVGVNPRDIPNGYDVAKHRALCRTIAREGELHLTSPLRVMACHESSNGREWPCVGWLHNQLNQGNNIGVRLAVREGRLSGEYELDGPQHEHFWETLPL